MKKYPDDETILDLFNQGGRREAKAFELLVAKHGPSLYRSIRNLTKNHEDTNDVLQNVLLKVYRGLSEFRSDSALFTWMYKIARNESLNYIQSNRRHQSVDLDEPMLELVAGHTLPETCTSDRLSALFQEALDSLPEKQALVFQLKYIEDLKYSEIAEKLQLSEGGLKANFHHARQKIELFIRDRLNQIN